MHRRTTLENGLRVVTHAVPGLRSCALGVLADAGPRDEPADRAGLAHLTEHLLFAGTTGRDGDDIARLIDTLGGQAGGFVTRDYTGYVATVLDDYAPYAIDLFGDLLLNSTFPEDAVAAQKAAVAHEMAAYADDPARLANDRLKELVWGDHPLGRPVAGRPETVARLTREDVVYFAHGAYLPDRLIVAAAGGVDHDEFAAQVRDGFWRMTGHAGRRELPSPRHRAGLDVTARPVNQAYFALAVPAPPFAGEDRYAWHLLATVLGGGLSARLYREVREARGLAWHIAAEYQAYADAGLLVVEGAAAPDDLDEVVDRVWDALVSLAGGLSPVTTDELWRARTQLRGQHLLGGQDAGTLFSRLATQELYLGRPVPTDAVADALDRVTEDDLADLAAGPLAEALAAPALAVVGPSDPDRTRHRLGRLLPPPARTPAAAAGHALPTTADGGTSCR